MTSIGSSAFEGCSSLTSITIPEGVTNVYGSVFQGCSSLTSINIPEGVTTIGEKAFYGCSSLTSIIIPKSVTFIDSYAFYGCSGLTSIAIPEGVTIISYNTFYGCSGLKSIIIPESVTYIVEDAFDGCVLLADVYCYAVAVPRVDNEPFDDCVKEIGTLHVPAVALEAYKATAPWSQFHSIVPLTDAEMAVETVEDAPVEISEIYHLSGHRLAKSQPGVNILRMSDGTVRKVVGK